LVTIVIQFAISIDISDSLVRFTSPSTTLKGRSYVELARVPSRGCIDTLDAIYLRPLNQQ